MQNSKNNKGESMLQKLSLSLLLIICANAYSQSKLGYSINMGRSVVFDMNDQTNENLGGNVSSEINYEFYLNSNMFMQIGINGTVNFSEVNGPNIFVYNDNTYQYEISNGNRTDLWLALRLPIRLGYKLNNHSYMIGIDATPLTISGEEWEMIESGSASDSTRKDDQIGNWMLTCSAGYRYQLFKYMAIDVGYSLAVIGGTTNDWSKRKSDVLINKLGVGASFQFEI